MKKIIKYFLNSDIVVSFAANPLRWGRFWWHVDTDTGMDPGLIISARLEVGPINILLFIDDGSW